MCGLMERMAERTRKQTAEAEGTYYDIVRRHDKAKPGDVERLEEVMRVLGVGPEALGRDLAILEGARKLEAEAGGLEDLNAKVQEAFEALTGAEAAAKAADKSLGQARSTWLALEDRRTQAKTAAEKLKGLRDQHPGLLKDD